MTLANTGVRPGEIVHALVEDIDLDARWLYVRNKPELGWQIKTRRERKIPLVEELLTVLRKVNGTRTTGPVFRRVRFLASKILLADAGGLRENRAACANR